MIRTLPIVAAAAAVLLSSCSTAPAPKIAKSPPTPVIQEVPYRWSQGDAPKAHKDMVATFSRVGLKPGEYVWAAKAPESGDPRVVVDLVTQMAYVYRGDALIGAASISSAKKGMITPLGRWTVLEKKKFHRSRKYDNAPMPYMQRLDEYGIAFHGGMNPGYPASHGCIRLPMKFAEKLYGVTRLGSPVVIEG